jgi:hypothetical protein
MGWVVTRAESALFGLGSLGNCREKNLKLPKSAKVGLVQAISTSLRAVKAKFACTENDR